MQTTTMPVEINGGTSKKSAVTILNPANNKTVATPKCKYLRCEMPLATTKYRARKPRIAKAFEL
jgi:hypothetical protein